MIMCEQECGRAGSRREAASRWGSRFCDLHYHFEILAILNCSKTCLLYYNLT